MSDNKFITLFESKSISNLNKSDSKIFQEIIELTPFLDHLKKVSHRQRLWHIVNESFEIPTCHSCDKKVKWRVDLRTYAQFCSSKCLANDPKILAKKKETCIQKYGVESFSQTDKFKNRKIGEEEKEKGRENRRETNLEKYGVEHVFQNEDIRNKIKQTNLEKYGYENVRQSPLIVEKIKKTIEEKYGVDHYNKTEEYHQLMKELRSDDEWIKKNVEKQQLRMVEKYGVINHFLRKLTNDQVERLNDLEWLSHEHLVEKRTITEIAKELNVDKKAILVKMHANDIPVRRWNFSKAEKEIADFIRSLGIENISQNNRKIISPKEIDIYLPDFELGIEYCGLFWHSELFKHRDEHISKLEKCKSKGVRLITIFEDEWNLQQDLIKKKISHLLNVNPEKRVFARKTWLVDISKKQRKTFLNQNHIQGDGHGSINLGLLYDHELVAVITLISSGHDLTINRYATNCHVIGGFSKLISYIEKNFEYENLITFADRRWSEGDLYLKTGFELDSILNPDYQYIIGNERSHKFNFRHAKLKNKLSNYDQNLSECENMINHGIYRIYNCGLLKFIKHKK